MVASELVEPAWGTVFVRAVGCGWAVSLGIYLGEVSHLSRCCELAWWWDRLLAMSWSRMIEGLFEVGLLLILCVILGQPRYVRACVWVVAAVCA